MIDVEEFFLTKSLIIATVPSSSLFIFITYQQVDPMFSYWAAFVRRAQFVPSLIALMWLMNGSSYGQPLFRDSSQPSQERIVLLRSGGIQVGRVTKNSIGYMVHQDNGKIQLPDDEVKFVVESLHEGYLKQRESIAEPTAATHLALANWCVSYRLYDDASVELKWCLKVDPDNEAAHRLLNQLTDMIRANLAPAELKPIPRKTLEGFVQPEVESLGGLSPEAALQFVKRVQPLMLHRCGNASCHGLASSQEFRVISSRVSGHGSRRAAEKNLAEIFRQIDFNDVSKSKLLEPLNGSHGGKDAIFVGQNAAEQSKALRTWVQIVAREKRSGDETQQRNIADIRHHNSKKHKKNGDEAIPEYSDSMVRQVSFVQIVERTDENDSADDESHLKFEKRKPDPTDAAEMARVAEDPFDPNVFNQSSHRP